MRTVTGLLFLLAALILPAGLQAACGGGGWHSQGSKPRVQNEQRVERVERTQEVSYKSAPRNSTGQAHFDTSRLDAATREMQLSEGQWDEISAAKREIRGKLDELQRAQEKAQSKFDHCTGRCDKEREKLERANDALNEFDANAAFDRRLQNVLSEKQMDQYRARKGSDVR